MGKEPENQAAAYPQNIRNTRNPHDSGYKKLFSHPAMVESLLRDWVEEEWVQKVDFSTLEEVGSEHITADFRSRYDDLIWKVRFQGEGIYIFLIMEFQSR